MVLPTGGATVGTTGIKNEGETLNMRQQLVLLQKSSHTFVYISTIRRNLRYLGNPVKCLTNVTNKERKTYSYLCTCKVT